MIDFSSFTNTISVFPAWVNWVMWIVFFVVLVLFVIFIVVVIFFSLQIEKDRKTIEKRNEAIRKADRENRRYIEGEELKKDKK